MPADFRYSKKRWGLQVCCDILFLRTFPENIQPALLDVWACDIRVVEGCSTPLQCGCSDDKEKKQGVSYHPLILIRLCLMSVFLSSNTRTRL